MILNVRGTNGSGKSTIVRAILDRFTSTPIYGVLGPKKPEAYRLLLKDDKILFLLGPYQTPAGGADCIQPYDNIPILVDKYAKLGHVLLEGVLVSKIKGQLGACFEKYGKAAVMLFLDTSQEDCIKAVQARRNERGDDRPFNPHNLIEAFKATQRVRRTLIADDIMRVMDISRENGVKTIVKLLKEAT